jgi:hypothetical protein
MSCSAIEAALAELNASFVTLQAEYDEATAPPPDPCLTEVPAEYSIPLHVGCIFVIFVVSVVGTVIPILGSHRSKFAVHPFVLILGKCCATGVILACALIHMLQPSNASLTSECLPLEFYEGYPSYAYLFAMVAALAMQLLEDCVERCIVSRTTTLADLPPRSESGEDDIDESSHRQSAVVAVRSDADADAIPSPASKAQETTVDVPVPDASHVGIGAPADTTVEGKEPDSLQLVVAIPPKRSQVSSHGDDIERVLGVLHHVHVHAGGTLHESKKGTGNAKFIIAAILMEVSDSTLNCC